MLLPFALAGVIVFFLLKHCLRCVIPDNSGFIEESDSEKTNQNVNRIAQTTVELRDMKSTTFDLRDMKSTTFELVHRKTNLKDVDSASAENNIKENEEI
jgi:S-adenosylmethionine hydrolase